MSGRWASSNRRSQLPTNWPRLRAVVRARAGGRCEHQQHGVRCDATGTDCDHRDDPDNHHPNNLQWLCDDHHKTKTQAEAQAAAAAIRAAARRPRLAHPGLR